MKCAICGKEFQPNNHNGRQQKYCSRSCSNKAAYRKRKNRTRDAEPKPAPTVRHEPSKEPELDRTSFERMMDAPLEEVLRGQRDRLQKAMDDPATPANALAGISRQIISICERLENMQGQGSLFDDDDTEVNQDEDTGAAIV